MSATSVREVSSPNSFEETALCDVHKYRSENVSLGPEGLVEQPAPECLSNPSQVEQCEPGIKPCAFAVPFAHLSIPVNRGLCKVPHKPEKDGNIAAWRGTAGPEVKANLKADRLCQSPRAITSKNRPNNISEHLREHGSRFEHVYNNSLAYQRGSGSESTLVVGNSSGLAMRPRSRRSISRRLRGCEAGFAHRIRKETQNMRRHGDTSFSICSEVPAVRSKFDDQLIRMDRELNDRKEEVHSLKKALRRAEMTARFSREVMMKSSGHMPFTAIHSDEIALIGQLCPAKETMTSASEDLTKRVCFLEEKLTASLQEIDFLKRDRRTFRVHQLSLELQATESALRQLLNRSMRPKQGSISEADEFACLSHAQNANKNMAKKHSSSAKIAIPDHSGYYQAKETEQTHKKRVPKQKVGEQLNALDQHKKSDGKGTLQVRVVLEKLKNVNTVMAKESSTPLLLPEKLDPQQQDLERTRILLIRSNRQLDKYKQLFLNGVSLDAMLTVMEERDRLQRLLEEKNVQETALCDEMETARGRSVQLVEEDMRMQIEGERLLADVREERLRETIQQLEEKLARLIETAHPRSTDDTQGVALQAEQHQEATQYRSRSKDSSGPQSSVKSPTIKNAPDLHSTQSSLKASGHVMHTLTDVRSQNSSLSKRTSTHTYGSTVVRPESTQGLAKEEESMMNPYETHSSTLSRKGSTPHSSRSSSVKDTTSVQSPLAHITPLSVTTFSNILLPSVSKDKYVEDGELPVKEINRTGSTLIITESPIPSAVGENLEQRHNSTAEIQSVTHSMTSQVESFSPQREEQLLDPNTSIRSQNFISHTPPIHHSPSRSAFGENDTPLSPILPTLPDASPVNALVSSDKPSDFVAHHEADSTESQNGRLADITPASITTLQSQQATMETPLLAAHEEIHRDEAQHITLPSKASGIEIDDKSASCPNSPPQILEEVPMERMASLQPFLTPTTLTETAAANAVDPISVGCASLSSKESSEELRSSFLLLNVRSQRRSNSRPQFNRSASEDESPGDIKAEESLSSRMPLASPPEKAFSSSVDVRNGEDPQAKTTAQSDSRMREEGEKDAVVGDKSFSIASESGAKGLKGSGASAGDVDPHTRPNTVSQEASKVHIAELSPKASTDSLHEGERTRVKEDE